MTEKKGSNTLAMLSAISLSINFCRDQLTDSDSPKNWLWNPQSRAEHWPILSTSRPQIRNFGPKILHFWGLKSAIFGLNIWGSFRGPCLAQHAHPLLCAFPVPIPACLCSRCLCAFPKSSDAILAALLWSLVHCFPQIPQICPASRLAT